MDLFKYKDYAAYKAAQTAANKRKLKNVYVQERVIKDICEVLKMSNPDIKFGLCHGTRRGVEQQLFKKYLGCKVLGTEISDTAQEFPDTIEWDFHEVKDEWINACDFVYSNSLDHAMNPKKAIKSWLSCLNDDGYLIIEWSESVGTRQKKSKKSDPFMAKHTEITDMIYAAGGSIPVLYKLENYSNSNKAHLIFARRSK